MPPTQGTIRAWERQFPRRRDHQRLRRAGRAEGLGLAEQFRAERQTIGDGLARSRLGGDEQIASPRLRRQHRRLHRGRFVIGAIDERAIERRARMGKGQGENSGRRGRGRSHDHAVAARRFALL